jgi:hypothetical protein
MKRLSTSVFTLGALSFGFACGGDPPVVANPPMPSASATSVASADSAAPTASATPPPLPATSEEAHKFVMLATGCWFGGLWADAEGESGDMKKAAIESRCRDVAKKVYGVDDATRVEQVRALDPKAVGDVAAAVEKIAGADSVDGPRKDNLVKLTQSIADAQRELMYARRAGDKVKHDEEVKDHDKMVKDEQDAVPAMRAHAAMDALFKLDVGDLTKEAHAIGILCVMDRVNVSRGLPRHLKIYAVGDAFKTLFGVDIPSTVTDDVTKPLKQGTWVAYVADVAKAAGHPVPDKQAKNAKAKYALAWAGMLAGIADKLKGEADGIGTNTELQKVTIVVKNRLEAEYRAEQAAYPESGPPTPPPPTPKKK